MIILATICCVVGAIWRALSRQQQPSNDARLNVQANRIDAPYRLAVRPAGTSSTDARRAA